MCVQDQSILEVHSLLVGAVLLLQEVLCWRQLLLLRHASQTLPLGCLLRPQQGLDLWWDGSCTQHHLSACELGWGDSTASSQGTSPSVRPTRKSAAFLLLSTAGSMEKGFLLGYISVILLCCRAMGKVRQRECLLLLALLLLLAWPSPGAVVQLPLDHEAFRYIS